MRKVLLIGIFLYQAILFAQVQPNVVLILTDDQGYGDMACHGNPWIKTPALDQLYTESVRFANFHVGTTCAPTRAMLMSGIHCNKAGVWHTINGRNLLRKKFPTIANAFKNNGYTTGVFGKWHLGDNYPFRPQDRGFDEVLIHGGGGIGQAPDYWENDYFDDTYYHNGKEEKYKGYCTDIWFDNAAKFIKNSKVQKKPFFCYIPTNAPHGPFNVAEKYRNMYKHLEGSKIPNANFYGMITNVDENVAKIRKFLKEQNLDENTIFIYMTDNGTSKGYSMKDGKELGFNAFMKGGKGSPFDGGHRVPFFLHWPKGGFNKGIAINELSSAVDLYPTLVDLCGLKSNVNTDGHSLFRLLNGQHDSVVTNRVLVVDTQRKNDLIKYKSYAVMKGDWRLVDKQLFNIKQDVGQKQDIAAEYPELVEELSGFYEKWWNEVLTEGGSSYERIIIDSKNEEVAKLCSHDVHPKLPEDKRNSPWSQHLVRRGADYDGVWSLLIKEKGRYEVAVARWPRESGLLIKEQAPGTAKPCEGCSQFGIGKPLAIEKVRVSFNELTQEKKVVGTEREVVFEFDLEAKEYDLEAVLKLNSKEIGAYYVYLKKI
jgi:arylsulfatase A-like enzyme